jgi:hypothetical protein
VVQPQAKFRVLQEARSLRYLGCHQQLRQQQQAGCLVGNSSSREEVGGC